MILNCAANLGEAAALIRNGNCSGGGGPPIIKRGATLNGKSHGKRLFNMKRKSHACLPRNGYHLSGVAVSS